MVVQAMMTVKKSQSVATPKVFMSSFRVAPLFGNVTYLGCSHKLDLVFVLDSSGSEKKFWGTIKEWVEKTIDALFDVGHDTQVGVVVFDDHIDVSHEIYLESHMDGATLRQKVHDLPFSGERTLIKLFLHIFC